MHNIADFFPKNTGLPVVMVLFDSNERPYIAISNTPGKFNKDDNFIVSIGPNLKTTIEPNLKIFGESKIDLNNVFNWIKINYEVIMELWQMHEAGDGDSIAALAKLKKFL